MPSQKEPLSVMTPKQFCKERGTSDLNVHAHPRACVCLCAGNPATVCQQETDAHYTIHVIHKAMKTTQVHAG